MTIVDRLSSVAAVDFLGKVTEDFVTDGANLRKVSVTYSWADLASAAELTGASLKLANQGVSLARTVTGAGTAPESTSDTTETEGE